MEEDDLVNEFLNSTDCPDGVWYAKVPVGLSLVGQMHLKEIDAVCVISQEDYPSGSAKLRAWGVRNRTEWYQKEFKRDQGVFDGERVVLVEAKTTGSSSMGHYLFKGVGQLLSYEIGFNRDWNVEIVDRILITEESDSFIESVAEDLGIGLWVR